MGSHNIIRNRVESLVLILVSALRRTSKWAREDAKLTELQLEKGHQDYVAWENERAAREQLNSEYATWQESLNKF
jgi:hypothetical protein